MNGGPIYNQIMNGMTPPPYANPVPQMPPMNPVQRFNAVMQAMNNPVMILYQKFPDIPRSMANDPNQIMQYLQKTRNISNEQLNQLSQFISQIPRF